MSAGQEAKAIALYPAGSPKEVLVQFRIADIDWSIPSERVDPSMSLYSFRNGADANSAFAEEPCGERMLPEITMSFLELADEAGALRTNREEPVSLAHVPAGSEFFDETGRSVSLADLPKGLADAPTSGFFSPTGPVPAAAPSAHFPALPPDATLLMETEMNRWERLSNGHLRMQFRDVVTRDWRGWLEVDATWQHARVGYLKQLDPHGWDMAFDCGDAILRNRILFHGGILLHASLVAHENQGILFSAPSQTGKTTQARLWKQFRGARILNGDRTPIRPKANGSGGYLAYGSPWSGAVPLYEVDKVPLRALVLLSQGPQNHAECIQPAQALTRLMPRCFLPYYDSDMMALAMDNLSAILAQVPVYSLCCRADEGAVEALEACMQQ